MAQRNIFKEGEPVLRSKSREVVEFNERLHILLDDMYETMKKNDGVGLAAPQVGISRRIAIVEVCENDLLEMINPMIVSKKGKQIGIEGCLSVSSDKNGYVERPQDLVVEAFDRYGKKFTTKASGLKARAICHEIDHLDGVLFIDKKCPPPKNS